MHYVVEIDLEKSIALQKGYDVIDFKILPVINAETANAHFVGDIFDGDTLA